MKFLLFLPLMLSPLSLASDFFEMKQTVLYVGGTHSVGEMGQQLNSTFREEQRALSFHAACGVVGADWLDGNEAPCGMRQPYIFHEFDGERGGDKRVTPAEVLLSHVSSREEEYSVIIQLGTEYWQHTPEFIAEDVKSLLQTLLADGGNCLWIGPASVNDSLSIGHYSGLTNKKLDEIESIIRFQSEKFNCHYLSSRNFTADSFDGVHFTQAKGQQWAESVFRSISR